jgi:hypothetical protein
MLTKSIDSTSHNNILLNRLFSVVIIFYFKNVHNNKIKIHIEIIIYELFEKLKT